MGKIKALHYDALDRLRGSALYHDQALVQTREYRYDRLGNLLEKDGRAYRYGDCGGPYTLCGAGEDTFQYDANGNLLSRRGGRDQTLAYTPFNKPRSIEEGGVRVEFGYGPDRLRVTKTVTRPDGQVEQIGYLGLGATGQPLYERHRAPGPDGAERIEHRDFLDVGLYAGAHHGGQPFAVHLEVDSEGDGRIDDPDTRYLHRDHLGSVVAVTDEVGLVHDPSGRTRVEPVAFAPFGRRLGPDWLDDPAAARAPGSPGHLDYTGQEALPEVGLIHMNGRLYDPELGRFLAADPFVQAPGEPGRLRRVWGSLMLRGRSNGRVWQWHVF
ncbi:MAG: hypothetical protein KatS3mg121_0867 [Gammaproteobacteria bacterium]|nr:MAG: hypothetical protein KatS3mg121_0867 [Gammaproteobacteria bacterium]